MKVSKKILSTLLLLATSACLAAAQDAGSPPPENPPPSDQPGPGGPGGRPHHPPPLPVILALDTNHDGVIDANEIAGASDALKTLDKNGDGQLTMDELLPPRPQHRNSDGQNTDGNPGPGGPGGPGSSMRHHPPLPPIVVALDANHDGVIDSNELANASSALKTLDKNGDGQLTREELRPPRPPMNGHPDGDNGPGHPDFGPDGDGPPPPPADN
jgi:EF hand